MFLQSETWNFAEIWPWWPHCTDHEMPWVSKASAEDIVGGNAAKDVYGNWWMVLNSFFFPPCHETLDRRVKALKDVAIVHKSGAVDSSARALPHCRWMSPTTSTTVPVVNFEVASTQKDMLFIWFDVLDCLVLDCIQPFWSRYNVELEETTPTIESLGYPDSDILSTPLWISI